MRKKEEINIKRK